MSMNSEVINAAVVSQTLALGLMAHKVPTAESDATVKKAA